MSTAVFAANNDNYRKRERTHRACAQCKRRRRRCAAPLPNQEKCGSCAKDRIACSLAKPKTPPPPPAPGLVISTSPDSQRRFIGDLNPEAIFLATKTQAGPKRDLTECGVWDDPSQQPTPNISAPATPRRIPASIPPAYRAYLESIEAFTLPPPHVQEQLLSIYITHLHPLLPLLDVPTFLAQYAAGTTSLPLLHSIFLFTSKHPLAAPLLPATTTPRAHASLTYTKTTALLHAGIETSRLTLTRIHALLALHAEGPTGLESASLHLCTALHSAFSLGLQLASSTAEPAEQALWHTLRALDAQQAAMCGRPLWVRDEDTSVPRPPNIAPAFGGLLDCTALLVEVIAMYRPGRSGGWRGEWRGVVPEDEVVRMVYYAVCILAHRNGRGDEGAARRRGEAARGVLGMCERGKRWGPWPWVPYAVALALATFYVEGCEAEFEECCEVLEEMAGVWWFAGAMAKLGRGAREKVREKEAAGGLMGLAGELVEAEGATDEDAWFLQLFPDLATGEGLGGWESGESAWDGVL